MIIGLGHRKRVGKDTFAKFLQIYFEKRHKTVVLVSFAWKVKEYAHLLFGRYGVQSAEYYDEHPEAKDVMLSALNMTPRDVHIKLGTDIAREIHPNVWVDSTLDVKADVIIATDTRFLNEVMTIKWRGGLSFKVVNPRAPKSDDKADNALADYADWDGVILNDGGLVDLDDKAEELVNIILSRW